ncbi:MAG: hypothetical protein HY299_17660 [Verrucomicrobia bacterium]|nr:hypothetical protein [Verrucomicrobiota bacterium]
MHCFWPRRKFTGLLAPSYVLGWLILGGVHAQESWVDVSSALLSQLTNNGAKQAWPGGVSGVVVNRTNGAVTMKVVGLGLWRSFDRGQNWKRIDGNFISGRDETGWATTCDANSPDRIASFSLDGVAGWTIDGQQWRAFTTIGRNWDYGSIDWSSSNPQTIIAAKHETTPPGEVYASENGGQTWNKLSVHLLESRNKISMVGALGPKTLLYGNGDGIHRSSDSGLSWTKVSSFNAQTRVPVLFNGFHYLGATNGLLISRNLGVTWLPQGAPVNIWQGPFFGRSEKEMAIIGAEGIFTTSDGGETWKRKAALKTKENGFLFTHNWFGCYAWDAIHNAFYASSMGNALYRLDL